jgi:hypothetical protein
VRAWGKRRIFRFFNAESGCDGERRGPDLYGVLMTTSRQRPGDPELAMIEALELALEEPGHVFTDLDEELESMLEHHLLALPDRSLGGSCSLIVKPLGRSAVRRFRERQADPIARKRALPDLYLRYAWDCKQAGKDGYPDEFLGSGPQWCGDIYSAQEIEQAGAWLYARGHITGFLSNNSDAPVRVEITADGADIIERSQSVHDTQQPDFQTGTHFHTTISDSNVNLAQQSKNVTQTQDNRSGAAAAIELVDAVLKQAAELPPTSQSAIEEAASALRVEAVGPARGEKLRELSNKVFTALVTAGAVNGMNDLGARVLPHLQRVLEAVGS